MTEFNMNDFEEIILSDAAEVPNTLNGSSGVVELGNVSSFVLPEHRIAISGKDTYSLRLTAINAILSTNEPLVKVKDADGKDSTIAPEFTAEHIKRSASALCVAYLRFNILDMFSNVEPAVPVTYRTTDIVSEDVLRANADFGAAWRAVGKFHHTYEISDVMRAKVNSKSKVALLAIVANTMHREQTLGHNWYTENASKANSSTHKICSIAGALSAEFNEYMKTYGHDMWHFVSDDSLRLMALALASKNKHVLKAKYATTQGTNALSLDEHVKLPDSVKDRYPTGELGKSTIILGMDAIVGFVSSISSRANVTSAIGPINLASRTIKAKISAIDCSRSTILMTRSSIADSAKFAIGYLSVASTAMKLRDEYPSLSNFAPAGDSNVISGAALAEAMTSVKVDKSALTEAVTSALDAIAVSLVSTAKTLDPDFKAVTAMPRPIPAPKIKEEKETESEEEESEEVKVPETKKKTEKLEKPKTKA